MQKSYSSGMYGCIYWLVKNIIINEYLLTVKIIIHNLGQVKFVWKNKYLEYFFEYLYQDISEKKY